MGHIMKPFFLLDTVILIDHLNGIEKATGFLLNLKENEALISIITKAEVLTGIEEKERAAVTLLLNKFNCLSLDCTIADKAAMLRKKFHWKLPDAFQAALAMKNRIYLLTRNTKDFDEKKHEFVRIPYRLE